MKLVPELVPETSWFTNLRSELPRSQWDSLRRAVYRACGYRCEICGGKGPRHPVECHEEWDYNEKTHVQKLVKMVGLCPSCHEVKHIGFAQVRGRFEQALKHMCKVNGIERKAAMAAVEEAFRVWRHRSAFAWTLDLNALKQYGIELPRKK